MTREEQFKTIIKENRDRIFRICNYYFTDGSDRDDAYQESLIRIWQALPSFRGDAQISTWIYRIVVNTCLASIRSEQKRKNLSGNFGMEDRTEDPPGPRSEEERIQDRKMAFFKRFMAGLPAMDRTLVTLYLEEVGTREMAAVTGLSEANVRVRIHRIKEQVKNKWEETNNGTR